jgi:diacylglycerol kinase (ATP)
VSNVTIIYNPASGSAPSEDEITAAFEEHTNDHRFTFSPTTEDDPGFGQTRDAIDARVDAVIALGGDGTVRAVAETLAGSGIPLGVVPFGTGNLLAKNLGIPAGFDAIPAALSGSTRKLDVCTVNGERFAVMAGTGFDALMIRDAPDGVKKRLGSVAYVVSAAKNLRAARVGVAIDIDGSRRFNGTAVMVLVGNLGSITGGLEVFPDADPADGVLDVAVLTPTNWRDWITVLVRLARNRPQPDRLVHRERGQSVVIELDRPTPWELDGEDRPPTDRLEIGIEPNALEVRCDG